MLNNNFTFHCRTMRWFLIVSLVAEYVILGNLCALKRSMVHNQQGALPNGALICLCDAIQIHVDIFRGAAGWPSEPSKQQKVLRRADANNDMVIRLWFTEKFLSARTGRLSVYLYIYAAGATGEKDCPLITFVRTRIFSLFLGLARCVPPPPARLRNIFIKNDIRPE